MQHPLIPKVIELAAPIAEQLGLEVVGAVFQTNKKPPVLRLDIRNRETDTSLDDCERMSRAVEPVFDQSDAMPADYILEVSSPGIGRSLTHDRDFASFKGFVVTVTTTGPYQGHSQWQGKLHHRDDRAVYINQRGRIVPIPLSVVAQVQLSSPN